VEVKARDEMIVLLVEKHIKIQLGMISFISLSFTPIRTFISSLISTLKQQIKLYLYRTHGTQF
jgi:hypothetical protein